MDRNGPRYRAAVAAPTTSPHTLPPRLPRFPPPPPRELGVGAGAASAPPGPVADAGLGNLIHSCSPCITAKPAHQNRHPHRHKTLPLTQACAAAGTRKPPARTRTPTSPTSHRAIDPAHTRQPTHPKPTLHPCTPASPPPLPLACPHLLRATQLGHAQLANGDARFPGHHGGELQV
jgi:hypothetical protein